MIFVVTLALMGGVAWYCWREGYAAGLRDAPAWAERQQALDAMRAANQARFEDWQRRFRAWDAMQGDPPPDF